RARDSGAGLYQRPERLCYGRALLMSPRQDTKQPGLDEASLREVLEVRASVAEANRDTSIHGPSSGPARTGELVDALSFRSPTGERHGASSAVFTDKHLDVDTYGQEGLSGQRAARARGHYLERDRRGRYVNEAGVDVVEDSTQPNLSTCVLDGGGC